MGGAVRNWPEGGIAVDAKGLGAAGIFLVKQSDAALGEQLQLGETPAVIGVSAAALQRGGVLTAKAVAALAKQVGYPYCTVLPGMLQVNMLEFRRNCATGAFRLHLESDWRRAFDGGAVRAYNAAGATLASPAGERVEGGRVGGRSAGVENDREGTIWVRVRMQCGSAQDTQCLGAERGGLLVLCHASGPRNQSLQRIWKPRWPARTHTSTYATAASWAPCATSSTCCGSHRRRWMTPRRSLNPPGPCFWT